VSRIDTAMVMAAGFGKRMRPLTDTVPKPLIPLCGAPLIDWTMARLRAGGITRFVVNSHYLGDQIAAHFAGAADVTLSPEPDILETGGGAAKALPLLGDGPFLVANADTVWLDGTGSAVARMIDAFDPDRMDALLFLHPTVAAGGDYDGIGDYTLESDGRAVRRAEGRMAPYLLAGMYILSPSLFADAPKGKFSANVLFDAAQARDRLYGLVHDGEWYHVGTPEALEETQRIIERGHTKANTR
jgi:MurNAc alpha-1-phosphate uridylyltransferase